MIDGDADVTSGGAIVDRYRDLAIDGPRAVVWQLHNPTDDPAVYAALTSLAARARRILLVRIRPATMYRNHLAYDTARALGITKRDIEAQKVSEDMLPRRVLYRLCGLRVSILALDCPHPISRPALDLARSWCDHLAARLVVISPTAHPGPALPITLTDLFPPTADRAAAQDQPGGEENSANPAAQRWDSDTWGDDGWGGFHAAVGLSDADWGAVDGLSLSDLPATDFPTFRAVCTRTAPHGYRDAIDHVYTQAYARCARAITDAPAGRTNERVHAAVFHALTLNDPPQAARMITLRAVQAAVFTQAGHWLSHQPDELARARGAVLPGNLVPRHHLATLRTELDPLVALANLLWGYFESGCDFLQHLRIDQLITDDSPTPHSAPPPLGPAQLTAPALALGFAAMTLPPWSLPLLRAFRCQREHHHSRPELHVELFRRDRALNAAELEDQALLNGPPRPAGDGLLYTDLDGTYTISRYTTQRASYRSAALRDRLRYPLTSWLLNRALRLRDLRSHRAPSHHLADQYPPNGPSDGEPAR